MTRDENTSFGLAIGLCVIALILLLGTVARPAQAPARVDRAKFAANWNEIEALVQHVNETRTELGDNFKLYAPWHVSSQPKQQRRRELYNSIARDCEAIAKRYRELSDLEQ